MYPPPCVIPDPCRVSSLAPIDGRRQRIVGAAMACALAAVLCLWSSSGCAVDALPVSAPSVEPFPDASSFAVIVIPDLQRTLDHLQRIVAAVTPPGAPVASPAAGLGLMLQDPGLKNLQAAPVVAVLMPGAPAPCLVCMLPCTAPQSYVDAATSQGMAGAVVGTLAVIGQDQAAVTSALALAQQYRVLTAHRTSADLRVLVAPQRLAASYGALVRMLLETMVPVSESKKVILRTEVSVVLAIAQDIAEVQSDYSLADGAIQLDQVLVAAPGSALALALVQVPDAVAANAKAGSRLVQRPALIGVSARYHAAALSAYVVGLLQGVASAPAMQRVLTPQVLDALAACSRSQSGDLALQLVGVPAGIRYSEALGCSDPAALFAAQGLLLDAINGQQGLARDLGSSTTRQSRVRMIGDVPVTRLTTVIDPAMIPGSNATSLAAMTAPTEMAASNGFVYLSQEPGNLDALVQGRGTGMTLQAQSAFAAGMDGYADADLPGLIRACSALVAPGAGSTLPPMGTPSAPLISCWRSAAGRCQLQMRLPLASLSSICVSVQGIAAQFQAAPGAATGHAVTHCQPTRAF